jgi:MFS family permease
VTLADTLDNPKLGIFIISLLSQLPIFANFILGIIADRIKNRFRGIIINNIIACACFLVIAVIVVFANGNYIIFTTIAILYCISSLSDFYTTYLKTPFLPSILEKDDYQEAVGANQAFKQTMTFLTNAIGAVFILWFSFQNMAIINSALVICSLLLFLVVSKPIKEKTKTHLPEAKVSQKEKKFSLKEIKKDIKLLYDIKEIFYSMVSALFTNCIFNTSLTLIIMNLVSDNSFPLISYQFSIVFLEGSEFLGVILGGLVGILLFKKLSIRFIMNLVFVGSFIWLILFYLNNLLAMIILGFFIAFFIAIVSAKSTTIFFEKAPVDKLSTISGVVFTLTNIATPIMILAFSSLAVILNMKIVIIILGVFSGLAFIFILILGKKTFVKGKTE